MSNFEDYKTEIMKEFNVRDVQRATWIRSRSIIASPLLITFNSKQPPSTMNIIGEQTLTKVYEYFSKPMICRQCLEYGHTVKHCKQQISTCGKCDVTGHSRNECTSLDMTCHHCGDKHPTASNKCPTYRLEEEIIRVQTREKISRQQAKTKILSENPALKMNYAQALRTRNERTSTQQTAVHIKKSVIQATSSNHKMTK